MSWAGRAALAVATLAATAAGWFVTGALVDDGGDGGSATATADVELISCPTAGGAVTIGSLAAGDRVWLVGVTGDRWAVIRHPEEPEQPAWVPLADLATAATADDLPVLTCADAETVMVTTTTSSTVVTLPGQTTTTTVPGSTTSSSSTEPSTTLSADVIPPEVTIITDREYIYVQTAIAPCSDEVEMIVAVTIADPTLPVSVRSIQATWDSPSGPQTANLTPVAGRFRLSIATDGPTSGEIPVTITATATDGAGNIGTGSKVVALRDPASFGCTA